jgi:hypothetical protein
MEENYDFSVKPQTRLSDGLGEPPRETHIAGKTILENLPQQIGSDALNTDIPSVESTPPRRKTRQQAAQSTRDDFTGPNAPMQVKMPTDLIQSLKLHSISTGKTMSELVLECLTSPEMLGKAWISTRKAGG